VKQALQFAGAGVLGYLVDAGVLLLATPELGPYNGRLLSFGCAVATTWLINRSLTFRRERGSKALHREFARYLLVCLGGGAVNLACYSLLVYLLDLDRVWLPLAVAVGSLAGMAANFTLSKRFVFTAGRSGRCGSSDR